MLRGGLGILGIISDPPMGGGQDAPIRGQREPKQKSTHVQKCAILKDKRKPGELS